MFYPRTPIAITSRLDRHTHKAGKPAVGEYLGEAKTIANFQEKLRRLYEQARRAKTYKRSEQDAWGSNDKAKNINTEIANYTCRWIAWARGGQVI